MNNTQRAITIALDLETILKTVYAESACLVWMGGDPQQRPAELTADNRQLLTLHARNALHRLAAALSPVVDAQAYTAENAEETGIFRLPLLLPPDSRCDPSLLRHLAERYLSAAVLSECYGAYPSTAERFDSDRQRSLRSLRLAVAPPLSRTCSWI